MVGREFHSLTQYDQNKSGMTASEPVSLTILIGSSETQLHNREWFVCVVHTVNIANVAHGVCALSYALKWQMVVHVTTALDRSYRSYMYSLPSSGKALLN